MTLDGFAGADVLVLGGGTAGAVVAGRLAAQTDASVLLVEAGPDYGPLCGGRWPADLLDAGQLPLTHDWGYSSDDQIAGRLLPYERARVIGGCSSHNGCQIAIGHRLDYDAWAAAGNPGWAAADLEPYLAVAKQQLCVRQVAEEELTPFGRATLDAMIATGIPRVGDLDDFDGTVGAGPNPANIVGRVRWNTAFAYLDPVRGNRLRVLGDTLVERLVLDGDRVVGAVVIRDGERARIHADRVVVCAGVYGSPAILLRSGIGDPAALASIGVRPIHCLPGVGANLHDHPAVELRFEGTRELERRSQKFAMTAFHPEEQLIAKLRSSRSSEAFDLHIYTLGGVRLHEPGRWLWEYMAAVLTPMSRGTLRLRSPDPEVAPIIDHAFLSDPEGADLALLVEAFVRAREIASQRELARLLGNEIDPGPDARSIKDIAAAIMRSVVHAYHPVGTCKLGPAKDPQAVVDPEARLHGLTGGFVADASIMPVVPRANTNLPTAVVAERVAALLLAGEITGRRPTETT
jgi:choline dehydrogenase